jgi:hypothetical protein
VLEESWTQVTAGGALETVTVQVLAAPETTLDGEQASDEMLTGADAVNDKAATLDEPFSEAVTLAV